MRIFSWHLTLVAIAASSLILYPKEARATTVDVTIGPGGDLVFSPSSVTIHPGDQVRWTWSSSGHSTTSGSPGQPNGIWDSGIHNQGATFTRTFNSAGTFPYYCVPHGGCCNMVGTVIVVSETPTPTTTAHCDGYTSPDRDCYAKAHRDCHANAYTTAHCDADSYAKAHRDCHADAYTTAHCDADSYATAHCDADPYATAHRDCHADAYTTAHCDADSYATAHRDCHTDAYTTAHCDGYAKTDGDTNTNG